MGNKKEGKDKQTASTGSVVKAILLCFVIGNLLYIAFAFLSGDTAYITDFLLRTSIIVGLNLVLLLGAVLFGSIENRRWKSKNRIDSDLEDNYQTLKSSDGYYMLYLITLLLDIGTVAAIWLWYDKEQASLIASYRKGDLNFAIFYVLAMNVISVFTYFHYSCKRVFYTKRYFSVVSFSKRETVSWANVQKIEYFEGKKPKFVFTTREKKITVSSAIFCDGWADFVKYVKEGA